MNSDKFAVWWVNQSDRETFRENPDLWMGIPVYAARQLRSSVGRPGRGRLWVDSDIDVEGMNWDDNAALAPVALKCAGIVIHRKDVPFVANLPGFVTDWDLRRLEMVEK